MARSERRLRKLEARLRDRNSGLVPHTAEFSEYIEQCRRLATDMGVAIPDPGAAE
jgi:hypothetical protein